MRRLLARCLSPLAPLTLGAALLLTPRTSAAFCGFYVAGADAQLFNDATVVVLMRQGKRTVLSMQNNYQGPPEDFALVIPVPVVLKEDEVKTLRKELFDRVENLSSPRLVEYWERDPCMGEGTIGLGNTGLIGKGGGGGTGSGYGRGSDFASVTVEAEFAVGEYDIAILSATESNGLDGWLRANDYNIPEGAEPLLRPYVEQGMKFFVAKVDPKKVEFDDQGRATLSPLRFHYDSDEFSLPVRLGLINAPGGNKQDLIVHILAQNQRYHAANYPNVTIPTNLDVRAKTAEHFGEFYVSLFDHTLEQNPGAVVTEYSWGATKCDPCPGPSAALTQQELLELGADVMDDQPAASAPAGPPVSRVRQGKVEVEGEGELDGDIIRRIVRAHINELRSCYNAGLVKNPALAGTVELNFTIDVRGKVPKSSIGKSSLGDEQVEACVGKAVKRWKFPKPRKGAVAVNYPLRFESSPGRRGGWGGFGGASPFVLTRLHARYDAEALGEDLVFEAVKPIVGGRERMGEDGGVEQGARPAEGGINNFQARYAIRHPWEGAIDCEDPVRGRWGGPPSGEHGGGTKVATQLARADRGLSLGSFVTRDVAGIVALADTDAGESPEAKADAKDDAAESPEAEAEAKDAGEEASADAPGKAEAKAKGCSCASEPDPRAPLGAVLGLLALVGLRRRSPR